MAAMNPVELRIIIDAQNKASAVLNKATKDVEKLQNKTEGIGKGQSAVIGMGGGFATLGAHAAAAGERVTSLGHSLQKLAGKYWVIGAAGFAMTRAAKSGALLEARIGALGENFGIAKKRLQELSDASGGAFSMPELVDAENKIKAFGIQLKLTPKMLMNIQGRAAQMGISTTKALDDIILGISRGSRKILDNVGLIVAAGDENKKYAAALGKTTAQLTDSERRAAFLNATLRELNKSTLEATDSYSASLKLQAHMSDAWGEIQLAMAPLMQILEPIGSMFLSIARIVGNVLGPVMKSLSGILGPVFRFLAGWMQILAKLLQPMMYFLDVIGSAIEKLGGYIKADLAHELTRIPPLFDLTGDAAEGAATNIARLTKEQKDLAVATKKSAVASEQFSASNRQVAAGQSVSIKTMRALADQYKRVQEKTEVADTTTGRFRKNRRTEDLEYEARLDFKFKMAELEKDTPTLVDWEGKPLISKKFVEKQKKLIEELRSATTFTYVKGVGGESTGISEIASVQRDDARAKIKEHRLAVLELMDKQGLIQHSIHEKELLELRNRRDTRDTFVEILALESKRKIFMEFMNSALESNAIKQGAYNLLVQKNTEQFQSQLTKLELIKKLTEKQNELEAKAEKRRKAKVRREKREAEKRKFLEFLKRDEAMLKAANRATVAHKGKMEALRAEHALMSGTIEPSQRRQMERTERMAELKREEAAAWEEALDAMHNLNLEGEAQGTYQSNARKNVEELYTQLRQMEKDRFDAEDEAAKWEKWTRAIDGMSSAFQRSAGVMGSISPKMAGAHAAIGETTSAWLTFAKTTKKTKQDTMLAVEGTLGAIGPAAAGFIEDQQAQAGVMALFEAAMAVATFWKNPAESYAHGVAAAMFAGIALTGAGVQGSAAAGGKGVGATPTAGMVPHGEREGAKQIVINFTDGMILGDSQSLAKKIHETLDQAAGNGLPASGV